MTNSKTLPWRTALTIGGFDGSGGAGIQADLKTFSALGCYGMTVLTALPIQNTYGVKKCYALPADSLTDQLQAIFEDIVPDAIKIGMLFNVTVIEQVERFLKSQPILPPLVLDPVMMAKSGDALLLPEAIQCLKDRIFPLCTLVTPNLFEAETLSHLKITTTADMRQAAETILALGPQAVLLKGGHLKGDQAPDLLITQTGDFQWFVHPKVSTRNTHGTGCTLAAAITAGLALQLDLEASCQMAKRYISGAIEAATYQSVGNGYGPVHHFYHLWPTLDKI